MRRLLVPMRRLLVLVLCALALPAASGAAAMPATVPAGVSVDGVDLSGLSASDAEARLGLLAAPLSSPVLVGVAGRVLHVAPAAVGARFDAARTVQRALRASGPGPVVPVLTVSSARLRGELARLTAPLSAPARNATATITLTHVWLRHSATGHRVDVGRLAGEVTAALAGIGDGRVVHERVVPVRPTVTAGTLEREYATVVTVDRRHFRLRLLKSLHVVASYGIAVGMAGLETPAGLYHVQEREVNPSWHVPNSPWAGSLAGQTIPPGPDDPIVARWLGLGGGIGIHGTNEPFSIGSRASHGCIRMLPSDVIALYPRVPLGTTVLIR